MLTVLVVLALGLANAGGAAARAPLPPCADNVDNDLDGRIDYPADPGCASAAGPSEADLGPAPQCADGLNNDQDGTHDWPDEPQCDSASDNTEADPTPGPIPVPRACSNGIDDDRDNTRDYSTFMGFPIDPGCNWAAENSEADSECSDGIDNDGDGRFDYPNDPGCILVGPVLGINRNDETDFPQCNDGRDNDGDGTVDERDPECRGSSTGTSEAPPPQCADGVDNDGDGKADFPLDPGCAFSGDTDEADPLALPQCADGRDNDGDRRIDLADPGCSSASDNDEASAVSVIPQGDVIPRLLTPFPIVRLRGSADRKGVRITLLTVRAPRGATVSIYCTGKTCPRRRMTTTVGTGLVRARQFETRMRGGTVLRIYVTKPGFIGKYTRFRFRTNRVPLRADRCAKTPGTAPRRCA